MVRYLDEAAVEYDREQGRLEAERQEQARRRREREEQQRQQTERERFEAAWKPLWDELPAAEREEIRRSVVAGRPYMSKAPRLVESLCLDELARRRGHAEESAPPSVGG